MIRKKKIVNKINDDEFRDLGFGAKVASQRQRLINRDGSFNVVRTGQSFFEKFSPYHYLVSISWWMCAHHGIRLHLKIYSNH